MDTSVVIDLVAALNAVDGLNADMDAAALNVPGVWVQVRGHRDDRLQGGTWLLQLVCVAADLDPVRSLGALADTYALLTSVVDPFGDATTVGVVMPDGPTLPGLSLPFELPYT